MQDPRMAELIEREHQIAARYEAKYTARKAEADDKRKQAIAEREAQVSSKRKDRQQKHDPEPESKRQVMPHEPIKDGFEEYVALKRSLEAIMPHALLGAKITPGVDMPHPVGPPGSNKGLPSLFECAEQLKSQVTLALYQGNLYAYNGRCYDFLYPKDIIREYREKVDVQLGGEKSMGSISQLHKFLTTDSDLQIDELK